MPPVVAAAAIAAAGTAGASIYSAKKQGSAARDAANLQVSASNRAADLEMQAQREQRAFLEKQAAQDQANFERTQRANYDQWASGERRRGSLGAMIGLGEREIPAYVGPDGSSGGEDDSASQAEFNALISGLPPTPDALVGLEPQLNAKGYKVLRNAAGIAGKIQLPTGKIVDVIQGAGTGGHAWQWLTGDGGGAAAPRVSSLGAMATSSSARRPSSSLVRTAPLSSLGSMVR